VGEGVTQLEDQLYLAVMGARTIVAATANVNPRAAPILRLMDKVAADYKSQQAREEETVDAH
jgi:dihydrodipicolinate synthase/N-acetylneuraminate lyase